MRKYAIKAECMCGVIYRCIHGWTVCPSCVMRDGFVNNVWVKFSDGTEESTKPKNGGIINETRTYTFN